MAQAAEIIQKICSLEDIEPGAVWERVPLELWKAFSECVSLDRDGREQNNPVAVENLINVDRS